MTNSPVFTKQDHSIVTRYVTKFYQNLAGYIPPYITPNTITLLGFVPLLGCYLAFLAGYHPQFTLALAIACHQSCDYLDGIHARATDQCSRLGCYLDHTLDAVSMIAVTHMAGYTLTGSNSYAASLVVLTYLGAVSTHLDTMTSGEMYFPEFLSIGELQWAAIAIHLVTAIFGTSLWQLGLWGFEIGFVAWWCFYVSGMAYLVLFSQRILSVWVADGGRMPYLIYYWLFRVLATVFVAKLSGGHEMRDVVNLVLLASLQINEIISYYILQSGGCRLNPLSRDLTLILVNLFGMSSTSIVVCLMEFVKLSIDQMPMLSAYFFFLNSKHE